MTQRVATLAIFVCATACAGPPAPAPDAGADASISPDGAPTSVDDAGTTDAGNTMTVDGGTVQWGVRGCDYTLRYAPSVGVSDVQVAGEFTGWADAPQPLRDDDGDGVYTLTLSPNARLSPGELYAYKLIVDGTYILDPNATYRKYDGDCVNSALRMPACTLAPEIQAGALTSTYDASAGTGSATTRITILTAMDGSAPTTIDMQLDGAPLPDGAAILDPSAGAYDIALDGLPLGRHELSIRVTDAAGRDALPVDLPFWTEEQPFEWRDTTMYMIVLDRFANGDTSIDHPEGGALEYPADYHGGDLQGALQVMQSGYFERLGVNVIWLSPVNQQATGAWPGTDGHDYSSYHGYWPARGRTVEPRFGGDAALKAFVQEAHRRGIRVLIDLINNQVHQQHEYYVAHPEWFRTGCLCGTPGCGWSERPLDCLFASYLPDINWRNHDTEVQFISDAVNWLDAFDIDGFRIDAVKHVETNAVFNLRAAVHQRFEQGGARVFMVGETAVGEFDSIDYGCGETYSNGYDWIDAYVGEHALDGQFDFPTHHRLEGGLSADSMSYVDVETVVNDYMTRYEPEGLYVRFLGTQDTNRLASRAAYDPAQGCRWPDGGGCSSLPGLPTDPAVFGRLMRAFTLEYTLPGIPFLYYGDEIATPGGNDPDNRRNMVWTGALSSLAMGDTAVDAQQEALRSHLQALGTARQQSIALRRGRREPLVVTDTLYVYAYVHDDPGALAVVAVNRGGDVSDMVLSGLTSTSIGSVTAFDAAAGDGTLTLSGSDLHLTVPAGGAAVFLGH